MLKSDAALIWLPVHVGDDIIVHSVTIDKTLLGCFNLLVALARLNDYLCSILFLVPVEAVDGGSI